VRLDFYREETASCSNSVIFGDFGIARHLPAYKTTPVEFTPDKAGEFTFACGMNMMWGKRRACAHRRAVTVLRLPARLLAHMYSDCSSMHVGS
jgi:plastocyanin domain-containing protein